MGYLYVQLHENQVTLQPNHLTNSGNITDSAGGGSGSRQVPVPPHLSTEAVEMGALLTSLVWENMSGGEAMAEGDITIAGTMRNR